MILELHQDKLRQYEAGKKRGLHVLPVSHLEALRSKLVLKKLSKCINDFARASSELERRIAPRSPPRPTRELPTLYSGSERLAYGSEHQRSSFGIGSSRPPLAPSATRRFVNANQLSVMARMTLGQGGLFQKRMNDMRERAASLDEQRGVPEVIAEVPARVEAAVRGLGSGHQPLTRSPSLKTDQRQGQSQPQLVQLPTGS